jgi:dimethylamine/trimethylamine dehydrogenase
VTPLETLAPYTEFTLEAPRLNRKLRKLGVKIVAEHQLDRIEPGAATIAEVWDQEETRLEADAVVLVTQRNSRSALFTELSADRGALAEAGVEGVFQIGDCIAPGLIAEAVFSGHRLAREIDSPDPGRARPFIRERRILGASEADYALASD